MNWGTPMDKHSLDDAALDDLFATARVQAPQPSFDLMDRVLSDALSVQELAEADTPVPQVKSEPFWRAALAALGGWPAMAGLATACVGGVWIGINPPDLVSDSATVFFALETDSYLVDAMPGFSADFDLVEG